MSLSRLPVSQWVQKSIRQFSLGNSLARPWRCFSSSVFIPRNHYCPLLGTLHLQTTAPHHGSVAPWLLPKRSFAAAGKSSKKSNAKTGKAKNNKQGKKKTKGDDRGSSEQEQPSLQHQEWVKFQQSIVVEGFETGQTVEARAVGRRSRVGRKSRAQTVQDELDEKMAERRRLTDVGGGEFPPLRYSDEETERLLAQAYAAIPPRDGPRGTRRKKRQAYRWHLVKQIRKKYLHQVAQARLRNEAKKTERQRLVKVVVDAAPEVRLSDRQYQLDIYRQWAAQMVFRSGRSNYERSR